MELARAEHRAQCVPASFDSRLFNNICQLQPAISTSKEANQAQYFGGCCWRKCLIRYFNILFSHSIKEFQDLDEMISQYQKFANNNDLSTILSSGLASYYLV